MKRTLKTKAFAPLALERLSAISRSRRMDILQRSAVRLDQVRPVVESVIADVARNGDKALLRYTKKFDHATLSPSQIRLSASDIKKAYSAVKKADPALIPAIRDTLDCISAYHLAEKKHLCRGLKSWRATASGSRWARGAGLAVGQIQTPLDSVGIYVPGGNAVLLTSALMGVTPAKIAGVPQIVLASPPSRNGDIDPRIVVAADMAGADIVIRAGGAQAIAALACGTESVPRVAKIVGPGNVYVAAAKASVASSGLCAIDLPAGPSEILIIADDSANPEFIAMDMLAQSEHDADASAVLVTTSSRVATAVSKRIAAILNTSENTAAIARRSLAGNGAILVAATEKEAVAFANEFAPEHLEIVTKKPRETLKGIRNAGGIFLGQWSPVAVGDYVCPNHILPTGGAARFTSGVNLGTFLKTPSVLEVPRNMAKTLDRLIEVLSKAEGLYAAHGASVHARAVRA